jgi:hypothetical protein
MSSGKEIAMPGGSRERADLILLGALASGKQVQRAAAEAGVSERTVFRRLASPEFQQQLAGVQSRVMDASIGLLSQAFRTASEQLLALLGSGSESMQLRAAQAILSQMTAVRMAILSDLQESRATVASDSQAQTLPPTDTDCQTMTPDDIPAETLTPTATDCQVAVAPVVTMCHKPVPAQPGLRRDPERRSTDEPTESLPPTDTDCQMPRSPLGSGQGSKARQTEMPTERLTPTATDCQPSRSTIPNRRRDRVKRPHLGWGIALPMSFQ